MKKNLILGAAFCALMVTGCSSLDEVESGQPKQGSPINVNITATREGAPTTRTEYEEGTDKLVVKWKNDKSDKIGIFTSANGTNTNVEFGVDGNLSNNGKTANFSGSLDITNLATPTTVYGYYPYVAGNPTALAAIPIDLSSQAQTGVGSLTHLASKDYMAATPVTQTFSATGNQSLSLAFNPLLTILSFEIAAPEAMTVQFIKLEAVGTTNTMPFYTAGTVDITTADKTFPITNTGTATNTITLNVSNGAIAAKATGMFNMMIFPIVQGNMPSQFKVTITTTDGKSYVQTKTAPTTGFVRGERSIMKLDDLKLAPVDEMTFTINFTNAPDPTDKTFIIPFTTQGTTPCDLVIEWGDGESKSIPNGTDLSIQATADLLKHTYTASAAEYQIKITTVAPATQQQMPDFKPGSYRSGDNNKSKLKSMDSPMLNTGSTDFTSCFSGCNNLTSIHAELFATNTAVESFKNCFEGCSGLTGTIPAKLFAKNTNVTTFSYCFYDCSKLTGEIPAELFAKNTAVEYFRHCFDGCSGLTGTIPAELFEKNTAVTDFFYCFYDCSGLTGIPAELFAKNTAVKNFSCCFSGCSGLTAIPALLFATNTAVSNFSSCFDGCTKATLNANIFCTEGTETATRFKDKWVNFQKCFMNCGSDTSISDGGGGTAPALWTYSFGSATPTVGNCFTGVTKVTNASAIHNAWK